MAYKNAFPLHGKGVTLFYYTTLSAGVRAVYLVLFNSPTELHCLFMVVFPLGDNNRTGVRLEGNLYRNTPYTSNAAKGLLL